MSDSDPIRRAYDLASSAYAEKFARELDDKPFDRALLRRFALAVGKGQAVLDLGCGPGHTTAYLTALGLAATGIDISPRMIERARTLFPQSRFEVVDFLQLAQSYTQARGILAFYCIVHLRPTQLASAFAAMYETLGEGGLLLLAFHAGTAVIHAENFLDSTAELDFYFFEPTHVESELRTAGFVSIDVQVREPYGTEHPSQRCYIFAIKG